MVEELRMEEDKELNALIATVEEQHKLLHKIVEYYSNTKNTTKGS